jgi:outer membrane protein OmpA-like peptidoglycan-associated protein
MNRKILWLLLLLLPAISQAQFKNLVNKAKAKIDQRIDSKVDKEMDKKLDQLEGKPSSNNQPVASNNQQTSNQTDDAEKKEGVKSYSKFDFVTGDKVLYAEDFSQDAIGELPLTWNSSGKGEVMTLNNQQGQWLRIFQNNTYLTGDKTVLGENYTIEFDLMFFFDPKVKGYILPNWSFGLFASDDKETTDNSFLTERKRGDTNSTEIKFGYSSSDLAEVESKKENGTTFKSDIMAIGPSMANFNKVVHYAIQVQKSRLRTWVNDRKIFDIPRAINTDSKLNGIFFKMNSCNYKDEEIGLFLSNIKVATGLPDTRHKLIEEGKFSTTGILFDVSAATIKPESNGVLKEIADALKANSGIKVKIIGHTDSDGSEAANLDLSKKRAEAVKDALINDYGIDASVMETDGKGESQPVADNKTKEGKAQNRRVEFVKM